MLLGTDPDMSVTPFAQFSKFLDLGMIVLYIVFDRKSCWVIDSHIAAETMQDSRGFICEKSGIRSAS